MIELDATAMKLARKYTSTFGKIFVDALLMRPTTFVPQINVKPPEPGSVKPSVALTFIAGPTHHYDRMTMTHQFEFNDEGTSPLHGFFKAIHGVRKAIPLAIRTRDSLVQLVKIPVATQITLSVRISQRKQ